MHNIELLQQPVVLVARGCLSSYFLGWWRANSQGSLFVIDFSRWRWFENRKGPTWIGRQPPRESQIVLFDRNTITGQTLRHLSHWLCTEGFKPIVIGHMVPAMGRFGAHFLHYVWEDGGEPNDLAPGGVCKNARCIPIARYRANFSLGGNYTLCVLGGSIPELGGQNSPSIDIDLRTSIPTPAGPLVYQNVVDWRHAMLLSSLHYGRPLITIGLDKNVPADFYPWDDDFALIVEEAIPTS